jgi:hypothetical protein
VVEHTLELQRKTYHLKVLKNSIEKNEKQILKLQQIVLDYMIIGVLLKTIKLEKDIIHYNEEDCVSTGDLRDFLLDKNLMIFLFHSKIRG